MAAYENELDALNSLYDLVVSIKSDTGAIKSDIHEVYNNATSINAGVAELRAQAPDIREKVTDIKIERIYIGDVTEKRIKAEETIQELLNEGYRPYLQLGISEDLARVVFVKYTGRQSPNIQ